MALSTLSLPLPQATGGVARYVLHARSPARPPAGVRFNRAAYAAAVVVADPFAEVDPWLEAAVDWDATLACRHRLWSLGLGVAEGMGPTQRGAGLDWETSLALVRRTLLEARTVPGARVASGCGTDHLEPAAVRCVDDVIAGYEAQVSLVESLGGQAVIRPSRALVRIARSAADYERVYDRILSQAARPVIVDWLGESFDPALAGYWGTKDRERAMETVLGLIQAHADRIDGIRVALLDKDKEVHLRRRLPPDVRLYTGDEFNYAELIEGDGYGTSPNQGQSDALLGIFAAIAPAASAALGELAQGNVERYRRILEPTVPLSRHIFRASTRFHATGLVFMAWLNGQQPHFTMVGGQQSARSLPHLVELFRLADAADLLENPELAVRRMKTLMALHGIEG